jgi:hypothetical protein
LDIKRRLITAFSFPGTCSTARNDSERPVDSFCAAGNSRYLKRFGLTGGLAKPNARTVPSEELFSGIDADNPSNKDARSERELFISPRWRSEGISFQRIPAERGASHPKFVLRRTIRARTVSCKELFPAHRRKQPSNQGFLELDVKCHDALFLSRFAKSVSPIIERARAAS